MQEAISLTASAKSSCRVVASAHAESEYDDEAEPKVLLSDPNQPHTFVVQCGTFAKIGGSSS